MTDGAWPDSEGTQRAVGVSRLIHTFHQAILMGEPTGGVFHAVNMADMQAVARAVGASEDDKVSQFCSLINVFSASALSMGPHVPLASSR